MNPVHARFGLRFWLLTLVALAVTVITASLGSWQLSRATHKQAMQAALNAREHMAMLGGSDLLQASTQGAAALLHRSVQLQGQWLPEATVYLENRQMQGRPGFWVLTPLRLADHQAVVLVQRGWLPRNFQDRTQLPDFATAPGQVQLQGRVAASVARLYEFSPAGTGEGASRIRQNLDLTAYAAETGLPLLPLLVLQTGGASDGLQRDWAPIDTGVDKHYGYAFQWFGLCALVVALYVWFQFVRRLPRHGTKPGG